MGTIENKAEISTILHEISSCEEARGVKTLLAVDAGSRCWGFASEDSDYDVRFVYVRSKNEYLRLEDTKDTIQWRVDQKIDMVGWDLAKFLRLMHNSNPQTFEWLLSPVGYQEERCFEAVRNVAHECFNPIKIANHHLHMALHHDVRYLRDGKATTKRYIYVVRALLAAAWAVSEQSMVPVDMMALCDAHLDDDLKGIVGEMIQKKVAGSGGELIEPIEELDEWISVSVDDIKGRLALMRPTKSIDWAVLDEVFLEVIDFIEKAS